MERSGVKNLWAGSARSQILRFAAQNDRKSAIYSRAKHSNVQGTVA
jgi:hypothetical protein